MKKLVIAVAIAATALLAGCSSSGAGVEAVGTAQFVSAMSQPGVVVLDVRSPAEYASGHAAQAVSMSVEGSDFAAQIETLNKQGAILVYCRSGNRAGIAADQMAGAGFTDLTILRPGGFDDLAAAGVSVNVGV